MIKTFSKKPARHVKTYWVFKEMFWLRIQIVVTYSVLKMCPYLAYKMMRHLP